MLPRLQQTLDVVRSEGKEVLLLGDLNAEHRQHGGCTDTAAAEPSDRPSGPTS